MAAKLKDKKTSITTVRDQFQSFATFPTPLASHWSLPLNVLFDMLQEKLGELLVSLTYLPASNTLTIAVLKVNILESSITACFMRPSFCPTYM